jgi:hypothetical protein
MLPLIPPTTLHEMAREYATHATRRHSTADAAEPRPGAIRALVSTNPIRALGQRINAWRQFRDERRYGTRIVSRSTTHRPVQSPEAPTRRANDTLRDLDLAA